MSPPDHNAMAASGKGSGSGSVPDPAVLQQFSGVRQVFQDPHYQQEVYWNLTAQKRGPPTPVASTPATTPHEAGQEPSMDVDAEGEQTTTQMVEPGRGHAM